MSPGGPIMFNLLSLYFSVFFHFFVFLCIFSFLCISWHFFVFCISLYFVYLCIARTSPGEAIIWWQVCPKYIAQTSHHRPHLLYIYILNLHLEWLVRKYP